MNTRTLKSSIAVAAFAIGSLATVQDGHASQSACITLSNNGASYVDQNEGTKRIYWNLWTQYLFFFPQGALEITGASGGSGNWTFSTLLFVQSNQGWVDTKTGSGTRNSPSSGNLVSATPPWPQYNYFACGNTDPI